MYIARFIAIVAACFRVSDTCLWNPFTGSSSKSSKSSLAFCARSDTAADIFFVTLLNGGKFIDFLFIDSTILTIGTVFDAAVAAVAMVLAVVKLLLFIDAFVCIVEFLCAIDDGVVVVVDDVFKMPCCLLSTTFVLLLLLLLMILLELLLVILLAILLTFDAVTSWSDDTPDDELSHSS